MLVNRRGYPGATPVNVAKLAKLEAALNDDKTPGAVDVVRAHLRDHAKDLHEFLENFILEEKITKEGGIILAGWSLGTAFLNALLAHASTFPASKVNVASYIKRVVYNGTYLSITSGHHKCPRTSSHYYPTDGPHRILGYPQRAEWYNPFGDLSLSPEEQVIRFGLWVSGYYNHDENHFKLELRTPLERPPPSITTMTQAEQESFVYGPAGSPGGSDLLLALTSTQYGIFEEIQKAALFPAAADNEWAKIPWRHVWSDHSIWEVVWAKWQLEKELKEAKGKVNFIRPVEFVRLRGSNHFVSFGSDGREMYTDSGFSHRHIGINRRN